MKRHAIFVDAGYLFAQGSVSLVGQKTDRTRLKLDEGEVVRQLKGRAVSHSPGSEILRVYWYDGARNGPTVEHLLIAEMADVKLRLGSINNAGEQKEVDSLLVTDLIELARNQSICDATLVASDSDLRVAVQIAQSFGVRVHLVGLEPSRVSQSPALRRESDTVHEISRANVARFLSVVPISNGPEPSPTLPNLILAPITDQGTTPEQPNKQLSTVLSSAIERTLIHVSEDDLGRLYTAISSSKRVPSEYDRRLLGTCRGLLGRDLTSDERNEMRTAFVKSLSTSAKPDSR